MLTWTCTSEIQPIVAPLIISNVSNGSLFLSPILCGLKPEFSLKQFQWRINRWKLPVTSYLLPFTCDLGFLRHLRERLKKIFKKKLQGDMHHQAVKKSNLLVESSVTDQRNNVNIKSAGRSNEAQPLCPKPRRPPPEFLKPLRCNIHRFVCLFVYLILRNHFHFYFPQLPS